MAVNTAMPGRGLGTPVLQPDATGCFDDVERRRLEAHPRKNTAYAPRAQAP